MPIFTVHAREDGPRGQELGPALYESAFFSVACAEARRLDREHETPGMHAIYEHVTGHIFWDVKD